MGWLSTRIGKEKVMVGDAPQDVVDEFLEKIGYDYNKGNENDYTSKQFDRFYKKAVESKTLRGDVDSQFEDEDEHDHLIKRDATDTEFKYHICRGLFFNGRACKAMAKKEKPVRRR